MPTRTPRPRRLPPGYDAREFPAFAVTVDVVILTMAEGVLHVLLVRRGEDPFKGMWAIPGGFKRPDETLDEAATARARRGDGRRRREPADPVRRLRRSRARPAHERRHRRLPGRRCATWERSSPAPTPPTRRSSRSPTCSSGRIELAFDHLRIVRDAVERVRVELEVSGIATAFVGTTFTMAELRAVYEAIWGVRLDAANFRRSLVGDDGWVIPTGRTARPGPGGGRPAELYRAGRAWKHGVPVHRIQREPMREGAGMRAVVHDRYGPPEVLRVADVERPVPEDDEVLVRVHASTVTRSDAMRVRSVEYRFTRVMTGIRRPRKTHRRHGVRGRVEEVGAAVTEFRAGDDVFGIDSGAQAEYVACARARPSRPSRPA